MTLRSHTGKPPRGMFVAFVEATDHDLTFYVRTTGDDSNDGLSEDSALATIQEALDRTPKFIRHEVFVDVGPGSFTGFHVQGFVVERPGHLNVKGTMDLATVATGSNSGTATGGSATTLVDRGQSWTPEDLIGKVIKIDGKLERVICDNDATSITFAGNGPVPTGKSYEIVEQKTLLTGTVPNIAFTVAIAVSNNNLPVWKSIADRGLEIEQFKIDSNGLYVGAFYEGTDVGSFRYMHVTNGYYNAGFQELRGLAAIDDNYLANGMRGCVCTRSSAYVVFRNNLLNSNSEFNLAIGENVFFEFAHSIYSINSSGPGIWIYRPHVRIRRIGGILENNSHGILIDALAAGAALDISALRGVNAGYGVRSDCHNASIFVDSSTTVTGSSGDATINKGITPLSWSTHFASDGDIAVNQDTGSRMERRDQPDPR